MAKKKNKIKKNEVEEAKTVEETTETVEAPKPKETAKKKYYSLLVDYGSEPNGKPRYPKGSKILLTEAKAIIFKNLKYI